MIASCDVFVFLDSVQFTRRDWRTRNRIKTPQGLQWLSVPVRQKGLYHAPIDSIEVADIDWGLKHLRGIEANYRRAPDFLDGMATLRDAYAAVAATPGLSDVNQTLIRKICTSMGITTPLLRDVDLVARATLNAADPTSRLVALAEAVGATHYLSGPSAQAYLDDAAFKARNITVEWMSYDRLPSYPQLWGSFEPGVSIVDSLLMVGPKGARNVLIP